MSAGFLVRPGTSRRAARRRLPWITGTALVVPIVVTVLVTGQN